MKPLIPHCSILGESPLWDSAQDILWWVDIKSKQIHQYSEGKHQIHSLSIRPSALGCTISSQLIVAGDNAIYLYDPQSQELTLHTAVPEPSTNRCNDGKIGPDGAFWFGTMDDSEQSATGVLYSLHPERGLRKHLEKIGISNTFAWSPCAQKMYFADSAAQTIWVMAFDLETGTLGEREVFISLKGTEFYPDGSAMDAEGCLWNAQWGGSRVVRYSPAGEVLQILEIPTSQPTSCAFVKDHLMVTTASIGLTGEISAGQTFLIPVGVEGVSVSSISIS